VEPQRRAQHYREAEAILLRELPVIPLYSGMAHRLVAARVQGWTDNPGLALPSQYLSLRN
jgi:peptide/nickel transport system substrate-binding protein/oligopeptide transport system substrate-binding protein